MINGIDVSTFQNTVDWAAVAGANIGFAYAKATEGHSVTDDQFARNWRVMGERRIRRGAYHFFHFNSDPVAQADFFLSVVQPRAGDLLPMVDVEVNDGLTDVTQCVQKLSAFITRVEQQGLQGNRMVIYTGYGFWLSSMKNSDAFSGHPLWIAEYNSDPQPTLPSAWVSWNIWQYSSNGQVAGVPGDVDLDRLNGDQGALDALTL